MFSALWASISSFSQNVQLSVYILYIIDNSEIVKVHRPPKSSFEHSLPGQETEIQDFLLEGM